jgi:hypothetical protein
VLLSKKLEELGDMAKIESLNQHAKDVHIEPQSSVLEASDLGMGSSLEIDLTKELPDAGKCLLPAPGKPRYRI